ncbi:MAG TPA: T9SS type A sorting domain-containing protein [Cytophagaceae bacterium]|jgi:hypothetical protein|nr:T9SS type A sorting domain-containing protein [Cytophagaceae bacterium]
MKKLILSLIGLTLAGSVVMAQNTNSGRSNNKPVGGAGDGYVFNFGNTVASNCMGSHIATEGSTNSQCTWAVDSKGHMLITYDHNINVWGNSANNPAGGPEVAKFYTGDCINTAIDLTDPSNQKVKISFNSPMAGQLVLIIYGSNGTTLFSNYADNVSVLTVSAGQNTLSTTVDLSGSLTTNNVLDNIVGVGLLFRNIYDWGTGDSDFQGTVTLDYIQVGSAAGTAVAPTLSLWTGAGGPIANPDNLMIPNALPGDQSDNDTIVLYNSGTDTLNITNVTISGTNASEFSVTPSVTKVFEAWKDSIFVVFSPSASATVGDNKTAVLTITTDDATNSSWVLNLSATVADPSTTAVTASVNNSLISVYPNPAKEQINLDLSAMNAGEAKVKVMNANGMLVYESVVSNTNTVINSSTFHKGIYMVQVTAGDKISNQKVVIE